MEIKKPQLMLRNSSTQSSAYIYTPAVLEWGSWHRERTASTHSCPLQHEEGVPPAHDWLVRERSHSTTDQTHFSK